jgi:hypothetical protein
MRKNNNIKSMPKSVPKKGKAKAMNTRTRKTSKKVKKGSSFKTYLPKTSATKRNLLIFVLIFGVLGLAYLMFSKAATVTLASLEAETMTLAAGAQKTSDGMAVVLSKNSTISGQFTISSSAVSLSIKSKGTQCSGAPQMIVKLLGSDGALIKSQSYNVDSPSFVDYSMPASVSSGTYNLTVSFANDFDQYKGKSQTLRCSRDLYVDKVIIYGEQVVSTLAACSDNSDNDGDGKIDFGTTSNNDPGCTSTSDTDETDSVAPAPSPTGATYTCSKELSPGGNVQSFVDSLTAGQTGCLRGGNYSASALRISKASTTLASYPGERATVNLPVEGEVADTGNFVKIKRINFTTTDNHTLRIYGDNVVLEDNEFTNSGNPESGACVGVGGSAYYAYNLTITRNIFKDCGGNTTNQNHAIYAAHFVGLTVTDNLFYGNGAYRIQLYPEADGAYVGHNIFDNQGSSRGGVVVSTETQHSRNHVIEKNIVINSITWAGIYINNSKPNLTNNQANYNCFYNNPAGNISGTFDKGAIGNITQNPLFVNAGARDYRLQTGSPCLSVVEYDTYAKILQYR